MRYSVRGVIRDSEGRMLWTTDTAHAVDTSASAVDLGMLLLVRAGSPEPVTVNAVFQCGPTRVHTRFAGDYLRISMDGRDYDLSREIGRAHVELQSLMRISYAVFCLKKKTELQML